MSASSEDSGESAHCAGLTEPSSFKRDNFVPHYLYALCLNIIDQLYGEDNASILTF